jgi:putative serine protease PepD
MTTDERTPTMTRTLSRLLAAFAALTAAALLGATAYAALAAPASETIIRRETAPAASTTASTGTGSVADVYRSAHASVVEITVTTSAAGGPFGESSSGTATGSGFVFDRQGHVVTNQHVVDGAESVKVTFANGKTYDATVVGADASTDLAVLDVDAPASVLQPLTLATGPVTVGSTVVAIGSPFGLEDSVTAGIVSAVGRSIEAPNGFTINGAIQTDAAINHGNSGGPLLDLRGRVVGVNAQISSESGGNDGVGFAIPAATVSSIVDRLLADGAVEHAYLGVGVSAAADGSGVQVTEVRNGSAAADAGLQVGDVITAVAGDAVRSPDDLQTTIDSKRPGEAVLLRYVRDGSTRTTTARLGTRAS